jgi:hypothetical protein
MRNIKNSRRLKVNDIEYHWRATGGDGYISIGIWPSNNIGPYIQGNLKYHETLIDNGDTIRRSAGNQIVVTNKIIRRIIEHAICKHHYNPKAKSKQLNLYVLDYIIKWEDTIRAKKHKP